LKVVEKLMQQGRKWTLPVKFGTSVSDLLFLLLNLHPNPFLLIVFFIWVFGCPFKSCSVSLFSAFPRSLGSKNGRQNALTKQTRQALFRLLGMSVRLVIDPRQLFSMGIINYWKYPASCVYILVVLHHLLASEIVVIVKDNTVYCYNLNPICNRITIQERLKQSLALFFLYIYIYICM